MEFGNLKCLLTQNKDQTSLRVTKLSTITTPSNTIPLSCIDTLSLIWCIPSSLHRWLMLDSCGHMYRKVDSPWLPAVARLQGCNTNWMMPLPSPPQPTLIKKSNFLAYKEIHNGAVAKSYTWLTASSYLVKYLCISSYIRKPFLLYDFAIAPLWILLCIKKILFSSLSVHIPPSVFSGPFPSLAQYSYLPFCRHFFLFPTSSFIDLVGFLSGIFSPDRDDF